MNAIRTAQRVAGRAAVCAFVFAAACGGDRTEGGTTVGAAGTDTTAAATAPTDTVAAVTPDTAAAATPAPRDTAQAPTDTASAPAKPAAKPATAAKPKPKPTTTATTTPRPAPKPAAPAQDTSGAQAAPAQASQDTGSAAAGTQPSQGTGTTQAADAPLRDAYHQAPRDTVSQVVYDGWKQYNLNCARCHGEDVLGTTIAPHLIVSLKPDGPINTQEAFVQVVCAGRPEKGMPAWCALGLEMDKINAIYGYVHGRSEGKIGPGRPAVKQGG